MCVCVCVCVFACVCVCVRGVYLGVMHVRQQATPGDMYMDMCMSMSMYTDMDMDICMPMRMWMRMRIGETGGPCLARVRCAHAARVAVAAIRAAGRLPCVCVRAQAHTHGGGCTCASA